MDCLDLPRATDKTITISDMIKPANHDETSSLCRICLGEAAIALKEQEIEEDDLIAPCLCRGTIGRVHPQCLQRWIDHRPLKSQNQCELCGTEYMDRYLTLEREPFVTYLASQSSIALIVFAIYCAEMGWLFLFWPDCLKEPIDSDNESRPVQLDWIPDSQQPPVSHHHYQHQHRSMDCRYDGTNSEDHRTIAARFLVQGILASLFLGIIHTLIIYAHWTKSSPHCIKVKTH